MAKLELARKENVKGEVYVDESCIDCDTCRWMSPKIFQSVGDKSAVISQPQTEEGFQEAAQAAISCPTQSIGFRTRKGDMSRAMQDFPLEIDSHTDYGVYHLGFHARSSFGAASYFVRGPEGNVMVDCPRFHPVLARRLEALGGVQSILLTHQDDVADHEKWSAHFQAKRYIHVDENSKVSSLMEVQFEGLEKREILPDWQMLPVPGHTRGSLVYLYRDTFLFTGDHLAYSRDKKHLIAFKRACWYAWDEQIKSMEETSKLEFEWILPGHGTRYFNSSGMQEEMQKCLQWMRNQAKP